MSTARVSPYDAGHLDYWRQRARETLEDAWLLIQNHRYPSAVNRIYYAMFYEVSALLLTKNLASPKHSGVRALFNLHFVKNNQVSLEQWVIDIIRTSKVI